MDYNLLDIAKQYLNVLCVQINDRSVGSVGNREATKYFKKILESHKCEIETQEFSALDWFDGGAKLSIDNKTFKVYVSPYSIGCDVEQKLVVVNSYDELVNKEITDQIILLRGDIAKEQLMPKNFVFYNPDEHKKIISVLEDKQPLAIICATGRNAALAGGVYPFPLIEDGDFDIPSVYMTEEGGAKLLKLEGGIAHLKSSSERINSKGYNVIGKIGYNINERILVTAHIDAKKGIPGAIDNATGVVILLLLAKLLQEYRGDKQIELIAFNGEDYYAVHGQMLYLKNLNNRFDQIYLNINIDGAGYFEGDSAFSYYGLDNHLKKIVDSTIMKNSGISEGEQWVQGDHSMFTQHGCKAIAVSSKWFTDNVDTQTITHTPKDNIEIVEPEKLVEIVHALFDIVKKL